MSRVHDKEDDSEGKQVNSLALIWLLVRWDLRSHVAYCADIRSISARAIATLKRADRIVVVSKNLNVILLVVEKDVLGLQISVREAPRVHVLDALQDLSEVVLADSLGKGASRRNPIKELATSDQLRNNVRYLNLLSILLAHGSIHLEPLVLLCNVYMIRKAICFAFFLQKLELLLVKLWVVIAEDFKGVLCTVLVSANFYFTWKARTKGSSEGESVKSCSHMFWFFKLLKFLNLIISV